MKLSFALSAVALVACYWQVAAADEIPCSPQFPCAADAYFADEPPSWIFRRGTYSHDPYSGARVAQYMRTPPVEPLDDERIVTSRYRRSRTNLRGIDGSVDTYYEVQHWGNGRGGLDAEWERFHDAWKESILSGGYYHQNSGYGGPWGYGGGYAPGYGYGLPVYGPPSYGGGPGYGFPPGYGGPPHGGWHGPPQGRPHRGGHHHGHHPHED